VKPKSRPAPIPKTKVCPKCGDEKKLAEFPVKGRLKNGNKRYGYCKLCHVTYQRLQKLARFGITENEYDRIEAYQGLACAICNRPPKEGGQRLAVDHDHKTGLVRGLLCWSCNRTLGFVREDVARLRAMISYLGDPPAVRALGREAIGEVGRVTNKRKGRPRKKKTTP